jgi:bacillithiol system protein YtxJ
MNWNQLTALDQLEKVKAESADKIILIFKHSTRCNISRMTMDRLQREWTDNELPEVALFYLDLLQHRDISNAVAEEFGVEHQSPQVLLVSNGKSVLDLSHFEIDFKTIKKSILENSTQLNGNI